jgi:hypothetical protein
MMIWHIFKKDWHLLRLFGLAVAALPFAIAVVHFKMGHQFEENEALSSLLLLLELMLYFGVAMLTAVLVHLDGLVSVRQDWLVRPVRRRDLLAAKLLFLLLVAQLPLFLANLAGGLIDGFTFSACFSSALQENLYFLLGFTLPIIAFVSLTRNLTEALGGAFALFIGVIGLEFVIAAWNGGSPLGPTAETGVAWIPQTERLLIYLGAAVAILGLQYFRRAARVSRYVVGVAVVLCLITQALPWRAAYRLQKALSYSTSTSGAIAVQLDPALGTFHSPVSSDPDPRAKVQMGTTGLRAPEESAEIDIPLAVSGLPSGAILKVDRAEIHLVDANGREGKSISSAGEAGGFEVSNEPAVQGPVTSFEPLRVRARIFSQLKTSPITLQVDYSATVLRLVSTSTLPALDADQHLPNVGWCKTKLNDSRTAIEVRCLAAGSEPECGTILLVNPASGAHNPVIHGCLDDYSPYFGRYKPPDIIMREGANLSFRDTAGLVHYPVDGSQIGSAQVLIKSYAAVDHFSRRLVIPSIRLADWSGH